MEFIKQQSKLFYLKKLIRILRQHLVCGNVFLLICIFTLVSNFTYSQELSNKEINKLNRQGIITENFDLQDLKIQTDFNKIIKLNNKRAINLSLAVIITTKSLIPIAYSVTAFASSGGSLRGMGLPIVIFFTTIGFIGGSTSIPFYFMYSRNMNERKKLLETYKGF